MHQKAETTEAPIKSSPVIPAANSVSPDTNSDGSSQAASLEQKTAPVTAEENPAPAKSSAAVAPGKLPESETAPLAAEKAIPHQKPAAPTLATSAANSLKSTLAAQLEDSSLAGKVILQVTGNTLTLSGLLTPRDHSRVLTLLHNVPGGVRVIDNIEYADELK
jgi:hypothetical protein